MKNTGGAPPVGAKDPLRHSTGATPSSALPKASFVQTGPLPSNVPDSDSPLIRNLPLFRLIVGDQSGRIHGAKRKAERRGSGTHSGHIKTRPSGPLLTHRMNETT